MSLQTLHQFRLLLAVIASVTVYSGTALAASILPSEEPPTPFEAWQASAGDSFLVDTDRNVGYLLHADGGYTTFPVVTGQRRTVRYIGRTYNASTPTVSWKALNEETKGDRITFGKLGRFLRLYNTEDGEPERTPYGIHSHASAEKMLASTDRYRSMGCIIVSENVLDTIIESFALNGNALTVRTVQSLGDESISFEMLRERMSALNTQQ